MIDSTGSPFSPMSGSQFKFNTATYARLMNLHIQRQMTQGEFSDIARKLTMFCEDVNRRLDRLEAYIAPKDATYVSPGPTNKETKKNEPTEDPDRSGSAGVPENKGEPKQTGVLQISQRGSLPKGSSRVRGNAVDPK